MEYHQDNTLELTLHALSSDGRAIGRSKEGQIIFVHGALPGQRILARMTSIKKRMAEAEVSAVLSPAPEERTAPCRHATQCGGCPWQCLPYSHQLKWKNRIVYDALTRVGKLNLPTEVFRPILSSGEEAEWWYRNKMEFAFQSGPDGTLLLGLRARFSHSVIDATHCRLQTERTMAVLDAIRTLCRKYHLNAANTPTVRGQPTASIRKNSGNNGILRFAVIREPREGGCLAEIITLPSMQNNAAILSIGRELMAGGLGVTGFVHSTRADLSAVAYGEATVASLGETRLSETLRLQGRPVTFTLDHNSFFQVNTGAAELLYNTAADLASELLFPSLYSWGEHCWDIYCGIGGLALTMGPYFKHVSGLENVEPAANLAELNALQEHGSTTYSFEAGDASHLERWFLKKPLPDLLVTDPPRSGMDQKTVQAILRHRPPNLILVSCNPATLARDLSLLSPAYRILAVQPVDLFPQTPHVETICLLSKYSVTQSVF